MSAFEQCLLLHIVQCLSLCCKWRRLLAERERRRGAVARGQEERGGGVGDLHAAGVLFADDEIAEEEGGGDAGDAAEEAEKDEGGSE